MFELPKNKMEEETGWAWKGRTVFSHFRHPLKSFARRVGRALTLLIRLSQSCMDTLEMDKIEGVKEWVEKTIYSRAIAAFFHFRRVGGEIEDARR